MDILANWRPLLESIFRWAHVVAGVMWIGHLWFFNFVNSQVAKTYDAASKKAVVPQLMPRALYWFRWGAAYTWISGILLLGLSYYMGGLLDSKIGDVPGMLVGLGGLVVAFLVYDVLWKSPLAKNEMAAAAVSYVLAVAAIFGFTRVFGGRATWIHLGALFGTIMAANVWMRIWPNQKKLIAAAAGGPAADPSVAAMAGLRSKHNTYMSVPLMFTMVSNHYSNLYGDDEGWIVLAVIVLLGWGAAKLMYSKSATAAPASYT
ncbi:MAG TPA: urate hydroxylase PuuD [Myxococcaceae bacterium]|nr:urate hydroxylase PuuD [Myxococcaceae bacterium]